MFVPRIAVECWLDGVTRNSADICRSVQGNDTEADIRGVESGGARRGGAPPISKVGGGGGAKVCFHPPPPIIVHIYNTSILNGWLYLK